MLFRYFSLVSLILVVFNFQAFAQSEEGKVREVPTSLINYRFSDSLLQNTELSTKISAPILQAEALNVTGVTLDSTERKLYWVEGRASSLYQSNLDGSSERKLFELGVAGVRGLRVSRSENLVVFSTSSELYVTALDGSGQAQIATLSDLQAIEYHSTDGKVYFISDGGIHRIDVDGQNLETIFEGLSLERRVYSFAINDVSDQILINYVDFASGFEDHLVYCELDGTSCSDLPDYTFGVVDVIRIDPVNSQIVQYNSGTLTRRTLTGGYLPGVSFLPSIYGVGYGNKFSYDPVTQRAYIASNRYDTLFAIQIDGSDPQTLRAPLVGDPQDIHVQSSTSRVYFLDRSTLSIMSIGLDGGELRTHLAYDPNFPTRLKDGVDAFTLDSSGEKLIFISRYDAFDPRDSFGVLDLITGTLQQFFISDSLSASDKILYDAETKQLFFFGRYEGSLWAADLSDTGGGLVRQLYNSGVDRRIRNLFVDKGNLYWTEEMRNDGNERILQAPLPERGMNLGEVTPAFGGFTFVRGDSWIQDIRDSVLYYWLRKTGEPDELRSLHLEGDSFVDDTVIQSREIGFESELFFVKMENPSSGDDDDDADSKDTSDNSVEICQGNPKAAVLDHDQNGILDCQILAELQAEISEYLNLLARVKAITRNGRASTKALKKQRKIRKAAKKMLAGILRKASLSDVMPSLDAYLVSLTDVLARIESSSNKVLSRKTMKKAKLLKSARKEAISDVELLQVAFP